MEKEARAGAAPSAAAPPPRPSEEDEEEPRERRARPCRGRAEESEEEEEEDSPPPRRAGRRGARPAARPPRPSPRPRRNPRRRSPRARRRRRRSLQRKRAAKPATRARGKENAAPPKKRPAAAPAAAPKRARTQPGPAPRWGHSAAVLEDGATMAVWGGEGVDNAVHLYRAATGWESISGGERQEGDRPDARAWHASVASASRLVVFGGDASGDGRPVRDSTARVYDIDEGEWTVEECAARPQARLGHALLALRDSEGQECVAALGGLRGRDDAITTTCDALQKRLKIKGSVPKGEAPKPHVHGCAVVLRNGAKAVVWTGRPLSKGDKDTPSNKVFVLERDSGADSWTWTRMQFVMGDKPSFRSKAACCLLPDGISVLVHGGLDEDTGAVLGDAFILDTRLWEWSRAPKRVESAFGARAGPR